jgi:hypothetical protein
MNIYIYMHTHTQKMSESRILMRIFGPKKEEMAGGWSRMQNEKLHCLHVSPNIIRVIKSKRMG